MPIDVVVSMDGQTAVAIEDQHHRGRVSGSFDHGTYYRLRTEPRGELTRVGVLLDPIFLKQLDKVAEGIGITSDDLLDAIEAEAIGHYLDNTGPPPLLKSGEPAPHISASGEAQGYFERLSGPTMSDEAILAYMAAKIYWGWKYGMQQVTFNMADARRCGTSLEDLARLGLAGDTIYWTRPDSTSLTFTPTSRLLNEYPQGLFPGMQRPLVHRLGERLAAPRYDAARHHFEKALESLHADKPDIANAVKEATMAVEALALRVLGSEKGTLGDSIKELRARELLSPPLAKSLEGLWGYSSEEPGVRHGKLDIAAVKQHEGIFAVNLAASALLLLLDLDK